MLRTVATCILDILLCFTIYPFLGIIFVPLYLYQCWVIFVAKIVRPELIPITKYDSIVSWDLFANKRGQKPLVFNGGCTININGFVSIEAFKELWKRSLLEQKDSNGNLLFPKFQETLVSYGGYVFRKPLEKVSVDQFIRAVELPDDDDLLNDYKAKFIGAHYAENSPLWEVVIIHRQQCNQTVIHAKIHHSVADGLSLVRILYQLLETKFPEWPREPEEPFIAKVRQFVRSPRMMYYQIQEIWSHQGGMPFRKQVNFIENPQLVSSTYLYFSDLKTIQMKTGAHYISINLALLAGIIYRMIEDHKHGNSTTVSIPLPLPNHPGTMCNHWTGANLTIPLSSMSPLERLKVISSTYKEFHDRELDKIMSRYMSLVPGILPNLWWKLLIESCTESADVRTLFSTIVNPNESSYEICGSPVISFNPLFGLFGNSSAICGSSFSYNDRCEYTILATKEIVKSQKNLDRIVQSCIHEDVEALLKECNISKHNV